MPQPRCNHDPTLNHTYRTPAAHQLLNDDGVLTLTTEWLSYLTNHFPECDPGVPPFTLPLNFFSSFSVLFAPSCPTLCSSPPLLFLLLRSLPPFALLLSLN